MASIGTVHAGKLVSELTLHVRGLRMVGYRMRLASLLFRAGARVAGVGIHIESSRDIIETTKPSDEWRSFK